jgi:hypothetical protein
MVMVPVLLPESILASHCKKRFRASARISAVSVIQASLLTAVGTGAFDGVTVTLSVSTEDRKYGDG